MALSKKAQLENDSMVYLDGPLVYTCGACRTHLTSHDDIISKSFHGRKGELRFMSSVDVWLMLLSVMFLGRWYITETWDLVAWKLQFCSCTLLYILIQSVFNCQT
jgi:hypothetical protein